MSRSRNAADVRAGVFRACGDEDGAQRTDQGRMTHSASRDGGISCGVNWSDRPASERVERLSARGGPCSSIPAEMAESVGTEEDKLEHAIKPAKPTCCPREAICCSTPATRAQGPHPQSPKRSDGPLHLDREPLEPDSASDSESRLGVPTRSPDSGRTKRCCVPSLMLGRAFPVPA